MSCEKVSLSYACGDQASSYCHIKCKNFPALLQGIVAHITKYVQGAKKRLTMITRMSISLFVWPAYSDPWCAKVHFTEVVKHEVAVIVMITTAMTTVLEW